MIKPGFTLIELLIASLISSILATLLFAALYQINRSVPLINRVTDVYEKAALINAQFERDLGGVTVPQEYFIRKNGQQPQMEEPKKEADQKEKKEKEAAVTEQPKPKTPLEKIFHSTNKDNMLDQLTFITLNPLQIYWSNKSGSAKPRMVRVLYKLEEEKQEKGTQKSYNLIRIESPNLEYDAINQLDKNIKPAMVAQGIKSLAIEYTALIMPEEDKNAPANKPTAPKKKEIKKSTEWQEQKKEEQKKEEKEKMPLIPAFAEITLVLWDPEKKQATSFPLKIRIPAQPIDKAQSSSGRLISGARQLFNQSNLNQKSAQPSAGKR